MNPERKLSLIKGKVDFANNVTHFYPKGIDKSVYAIQEPMCMSTPLDILPQRSESRLAVLEVLPEEKDMLAKIKGFQGPTLKISALDVKGRKIATTSINWNTILGAPNPFTKA
jgi:hypothetical protein